MIETNYTASLKLMRPSLRARKKLWTGRGAACLQAVLVLREPGGRTIAMPILNSDAAAPQPISTDHAHERSKVCTDEAKAHAEMQGYEHARVSSHSYGISRGWVEQRRRESFDVILEIDWQGADEVRGLESGTCSIFILPPSVETRRQRLESRALGAAAAIDRCGKQAEQKIAQASKADYLVINEDCHTALADIRACRLRRDGTGGR